MWSGWVGGGEQIVVCGGEMNHLIALGIDERTKLIGSTRNGSSLNWDDFSLDGDFCQAVVKTVVNHWVA